METQRGESTERAPGRSLCAGLNTLVPAGPMLQLPRVEGGIAWPRLEIPSEGSHVDQGKEVHARQRSKPRAEGTKGSLGLSAPPTSFQGSSA